MAFGIAAPLPYEAIGHGLLFVDIAIAMYDLDKFKRINDMYGHSAGDEVLVAVSEAVRSRLCEDEILVRWGGEEFIVIMKQNERRFEEHAQEIREWQSAGKKIIRRQLNMQILHYTGRRIWGETV